MKETTLMELVNDCQNAEYEFLKVDERLKKAMELKELGFKKMGNELERGIVKQNKLNALKGRYIVITDNKIEKFLERKVKVYNRSVFKPKPEAKPQAEIREASFYPLLFSYSPIFSNLEIVSKNKLLKKTKDYNDASGKKIGKFEWTETKIKDYKGVPPREALQKLRQEKDKGMFDYYTIGEVENIPDPILLGRITDCEDRFFLCQWGNDVTLDDLL